MISDLVLRPATPADAESIWDLLSVATDTTGMTSLPTDRDGAATLCRETARTVADLAAGSFELDEGQRRPVLFVAVAGGGAAGDGEQVVGLSSCTFKAAVPNLAVRVQTGRSGEGLVMRSVSQPWTRSELGSTYLAPEARRQGHGTLLSRGRMMLLHTVASQVPTTIASHLRGVFDDDGTAPFWTCFGRLFAPQWDTSTNAEEALSSDPTNLEKLAGLTLPLEATVLPTLGAVNTASRPAYRLLLAEGLEPTGMFDPIDGGPTVVGQLAGLVTRRLRRYGTVVIGDGVGEAGTGTRRRPAAADALVATTALGAFRVTRAVADTSTDGQVVIDGTTAERLGVRAGGLVAASLLAHRCGPVVVP